MKVPHELLRVAQKLGPIRERVVFVGGMIRGLLVTDPAAGPARPTDDVDLIIDLPTHSDFAALGQELRGQGFQECTEKGAPMCRWIVDGIKADVMPVDPGILGFSNIWYVGAIEASHTVGTSEGELRILSAPHFIATKLEAYASRGGDDIYHHDLEDVIALVDGRDELLDDLVAASYDLRSFVVSRVTELLADPRFMEGLRGHLEGDEAAGARLPLLVQRLRNIASLGEAASRAPARTSRRRRGLSSSERSTGLASGAGSLAVPVSSSNIDLVEYDVARRVLRITFHRGRSYEYDGVPPNVYSGLMGAWSKGRYFHSWIRGRYPYRET